MRKHNQYYFMWVVSVSQPILRIITQTHFYTVTSGQQRNQIISEDKYKGNKFQLVAASKSQPAQQPHEFCCDASSERSKLHLKRQYGALEVFQIYENTTHASQVLRQNRMFESELLDCFTCYKILRYAAEAGHKRRKHNICCYSKFLCKCTTSEQVDLTLKRESRCQISWNNLLD